VSTQWEDSTIGDAATVIAGQSPDGTSYNDSGKGMPFYQGKKEFGDKFIGPPTTWTTQTKRIAQAGDVLMSVRAPVGPVNFATQECCIGRGLAAIRSGPRLARDFLFYFLLHKQDEIAGTEGAVFACINKDQIESIGLPLPPLPEQRRIVAILDEAFAAIATAKANTEQNLANARAVFESEVAEVFSRRDANHPLRQVGDVCELTVGHVGSMAARYKSTGIPFLRSQNIRPFRVDLDGLVYIDNEFHNQLAKSQLKPGDVAIVRTGYPGTAAVIPTSLPVSNCSDLVIVRPGREADPDYLALFFNSTHGKGLVAGRLVGAAQKHFNVGAASRVSISLPPLKEQTRTVKALHIVLAETQRLESLAQRKLSALDALKASLLHHAFTGQLGVPPLIQEREHTHA
jgi:type I restriction enzyme S subunit